MHMELNTPIDSESIRQKNKLSRENAQLHMLAEDMARVLRRWLDDSNMKYFWTSEDKEALNAYDRFKEDVIWKQYNPPS